MTDWSGERFEGVNPSDRSDPDGHADAGPCQAGSTDRIDGIGGQWAPEAPPLSGGLLSLPPLSGSPQQAAPGVPAGPKARKSRKRLVVAFVAAGALLVALVVVVVATVAERDRGQAGGSAGDAVKSYLEALARGDATTALSYGVDQPATDEFLTGEILKRQVAQWPIRNIRILHDNSSAPGAAQSMAHVHVVATFGDQTSDAILDLWMDHNRWKLASAAIKFTPGLGASMDNAAAKTVTLFGMPIGDSTVYVFPGWVDIGSTNPYVTVTVEPLVLDQLTMAAPFWVHPNFALAERGRDAVRAELAGAMLKCQQSNLLAPPGCPVRLDHHGLVEGTVGWGTADLSAVKLEKFDSYRMTQTFSGQIRVPVTVETSGGATKRKDVTEFLSGIAELAKIPPELTFQ
ncbi:hypothetical protein OQ968_03785 [Mycobacterium sp. 663a-19]|uniref:hypothetical protein n=1 Tax=Mycobacterium sp. 663a-19 TaxID=2986148 RepID=UPI002D1F2B83|nr:hypothetical protein [Mycobacterium sp. 663a-19]MEB3980379.1 hypothetical protein [Mycobacterium sp. 663a-19]